jgi:hypothetical protein
MTTLSLFDDAPEASSGWDFRAILLADDNWERYQIERAYQLRPIEIEEVDKMLACGDPKAGFVTLLCLNCGAEKRIPFTCKSRLCSRCGKRHTDSWSEQIGSGLYDVVHRHMVFTIPDILWRYFKQASTLQKLLVETAVHTIQRYVRLKRGEDVVPGIIAVLHPFGSDLESKSHVHLLVTEGGIASKRKWVDLRFFSYDALRKMWQYDILKALRKAFPTDRELLRQVDACFRKYRKGFNLQAKRRIDADRMQVVRYLARYVRHPAISRSRILDYDGKDVTFVYTRDNQKLIKKLPVFEFIEKVLSHLPDKHFKVVRHFGLYARRCRGMYQRLMKKLHRFAHKTVRRFTWRWNVRKLRGEDPHACPHCGYEMEVFKITYRWRGKWKTVGGFDWLRHQGIIRDLKASARDVIEHVKARGRQLSLFDPLPRPSVEQLSLCFE